MQNKKVNVIIKMIMLSCCHRSLVKSIQITGFRLNHVTWSTFWFFVP